MFESQKFLSIGRREEEEEEKKKREAENNERKGKEEDDQEDDLQVIVDDKTTFPLQVEVDVDEHSDSVMLAESLNCIKVLGLGGKGGPLLLLWMTPTWDAQILSTVLTRSELGGSGGGGLAGNWLILGKLVVVPLFSQSLLLQFTGVGLLGRQLFPDDTIVDTGPDATARWTAKAATDEA